MAFGRSKESSDAGERVVPRHIAIIMDGNGRWAKRRGLPRPMGHRAGSETFRRIATYCRNIGVQYLTVYAFSTENWKRAEDEVSAIMGLLKKYLLEALQTMEQERIRIYFFGDLSRLPDELQQLAAEAQEKSKRYTGCQVNLCLNYGGRDEIVRAARAWAADCTAGKCRAEELDEAQFAGYLYSGGIPDPELIIRPSGEIRTSNFLLWQSAYSEYYFTDVLWPDFSPSELLKAIASFQGRSRRFGGV